MTTLTHTLHANYLAEPERVAITLLHANQPEEHLTYRRLLLGAAGYARALNAQGIQPGDVVILVLQHGIDLIYSFYGAILHGAIPSIMPFLTEKLSPERYQEDMTALIKITQPAAIVTYPEFLPVVTGTLQAGGSVRAVISTDAVAPVEELDFSGLRGYERTPEDIVLLQHSSGTTGMQKGVALAHQAVLNQLESYAAAIHLSSEDVIISWLPLYHDMGLIAGFIMPVLNRVPLVLMSPFDWVRAPFRLMQAITRYHGTLAWLPNFAYNFCATKIRDRDLEGVDLSSWRAVINCSEPMRWESQQAFLQRFQPYGFRSEALATCYAMAENVFGVTQGGIDGPGNVDEIDAHTFITRRLAVPATGQGETIKILSAGWPITNTRVKVVDEHRRDLPDRQIGELVLLSDCMLTGYFHRADLTHKAFHEGWYLTGDLGYMLNGEVYVVGRKKDMIIVGGKNIYPQDLELLANQVPGVHPGRVVAFGIFDQTIGTEEVGIVAEVDTDDPDQRQKIEDAIRQKIARGSAVAPHYVQLVGPKWIIKTSSGKIARSANRDKFIAEFGSEFGT